MDQLSHKIGSAVERYVRDSLGIAAKIPGSTYLGRYIVKSHQNDPARTIFEILLFLFALRYFFASKQSYSKRDYVQLSDAEVEELIEEWQPEPLVKPMTAEEEMLLEEVPVLSDTRDGYATLAPYQGNERLLNMCSTNLYGLSKDPEVIAKATEKVKFYGVGSCGPAGFYGNQDAHVKCEQSLAHFLGTEGAILYSQGVSTAPSVIPCFAKRGDVLVVDEAVSMPLQRGIQLSRAKVLYFAHNDMAHLELQLSKAVAAHRGVKRLPRRFIISEGLFEYTGDSPDLVKIVELKLKYKFRLILDESWSLGVLGNCGRGLCEEQGVARNNIDVTIGSLATAVGTYGGFCAGSRAVVEHQRIVSLAYTFSATEPPYLADCTTLIVNKMASGEFCDRIRALRSKAAKFTSLLQKHSTMELISRPDSPIIIFQVNSGDKIEDDNLAVSKLLHRVVMAARKNGLLIARLGQIEEWETFELVNAIKIYLPLALPDAEVRKTVDALAKSVKQAIAGTS